MVHPDERTIGMSRAQEGYFIAEAVPAAPGTRYFYIPDDEQAYPDPASSFQPEGVHGPSEVVDHEKFGWTDAGWRGIPFNDLILYELHVGAFTAEGTFDAIVSHLDSLLDTGINAIELMPVAQFPGNRNWGYDGAFPFAVQDSYGGPDGLKRLVDACHRKGMAVFLDVVYNHLGPEGNYLDRFGPYFTDRYHTPWGRAINFDQEWSDGVRDFFSANPVHWFRHYHIDGLRADAIHTVFDSNAVHFWELVYDKVRQLEQQLGRSLYLIAESDYNSPKVIKSPEAGGYGFTAQWLDDFHHALYVILHEEGKDRYADFGSMEQLAKAYTDGFVHSGEYVEARKKRHGASSAGIRGDKFIVFNQNHDQVGNRIGGERLSVLTDFDRQKTAAAALILSPYIPMLFMGEEYGETVPFLYFISHSDQRLIEAVRTGREHEFAAFINDGHLPDPQDEAVFNACKLDHTKRKKGKHRLLQEWSKTLIGLRRSYPLLQNFDKNNIRAHLLEEKGLLLHRQRNDGKEHVLCLFNFSDTEICYPLPSWAERWEQLLDSSAPRWCDPDTPEIPEEQPVYNRNDLISVSSRSTVVLSSRQE